MATKVSPLYRITCFPASAIPRADYNHYAIPDDIADAFRVNHGESASVRDTGFRSPGAGNPANTALGQPAFTNVSEVKLILFGAPGGRVYEGAAAISHFKASGGTIGFILQERVSYCDNKLTPAISGDPTGTGLTAIVQWQKVGTGPDWHTVTPTARPVTSRVMYTTALPTTVMQLQTVLVLPADQSFQEDISFAGVARQNTAAYKTTSWGGGAHAVTWTEGGHPFYSRYVSDAQGTGLRCVRVFTEVPKTIMHGPHRQNVRFRARLIAGHLVLDFNELSFDVTNPVPQGTVQPGQPAQYKEAPITWPAAPVLVTSAGVRAAFAVHPIQYAKLLAYDGVSSALAGTFTRQVATQYGPPSGTIAGGGVTRGTQLPGTTGVVSSWASGTGGLGGLLNYTVTMTGDNPTVAPGATEPGVHTPFVSAVICESTHSPSVPSVGGIEVQQFCFGSGTVESGEPPGMVTKQATIKLSRRMLDSKYGGTSWTAYVKQFNPIRIEVAWRYDDNTTSAYKTIFDGYIISPTKDLGGFNDWNGELVCRDHTTRLTNPAGFIDATFRAPLDIVALLTQDKVYGGGCVREVIRGTIGDSFADILNGGTGTAYDLKYFPTGHYPLISTDNDVAGLYPECVPQENKWILPPPYGSYAMNWIQDTIAPMDHAVFYWDLPPDGSYPTPIPLYGRITEFYKAAQAAGSGGINLTVTDKEYISGDLNKIIQSASSKFLYERAFNEFQVWGPRSTGNAATAYPSLISGLYRLLDSDQNSEANSWRRTLLLEPNILQNFAGNDLAQVIAALTGAEFTNRDHQDVSITMRGQEQLCWGQVLHCNLSGSGSDTTIGLNGNNFRITRLVHTLGFDMDSADPFTTTAYCRSLSASGF